MGTRADFYVGRGPEAEWLGSIAMDGYPQGWAGDSAHGPVVASTTEEEYRANVAKVLTACDHSTKPEQGWPWPWEDSRTTDYAYAFDGGLVYATCFGRPWFEAWKDGKPSEPEDEEYMDQGKTAVFPDMTAVAKPTLGRRSGLIVFGSGGGE